MARAHLLLRGVVSKGLPSHLTMLLQTRISSSAALGQRYKQLRSCKVECSAETNMYEGSQRISNGGCQYGARTKFGA